MAVHSKWLFVFIGNNDTGKSTVQRALVELLTGRTYERLLLQTKPTISLILTL